MTAITWVHISDLHWREKKAYDANVVAQALLKDLEARTEIASGLEHIDLVFVTGDIAFAAKPEEYQLARRFLAELRKATEVRKDRLFVVPGNHDVDRELAKKSQHLADGATDRQKVNQLLGNAVDRAALMERLGRYRQFTNDLWGKGPHFDSEPYFYVKKRRIAGKQVAILGLNSAWASASDADRNNLLLGERQVRDALEQAKKADLRIALLHHPLDWLRDFDRGTCQSLLLGGCDFILHGHLHETSVGHWQAPGSRAWLFEAGACYEGPDYPHTYNLVQYDPDSGQGTIYLRIYSPHGGGCWVQDEMTYPGVHGQFPFTLPVRPPQAPPGPPKPSPKATGVPTPTALENWWAARGYTRNPFKWLNAGSIDLNTFADVVEWWVVDPNAPVELKGIGPTPTLEQVMRPDDSEPVLIYAPAGGGKTFYRRWAGQQIEQRGKRQIDVPDIRERLRTSQPISAHTFAVCIYDCLCDKLQRSQDPNPPGDIGRIFRRCDQLIAEAFPGVQGVAAYVLIDDVASLFDKRPQAAVNNARTLTALIDLCRVAAGRGGEGHLALRLFIPSELKEEIQGHLGDMPRQPYECDIAWTAKHCELVIERRLDSCWKDEPESGTIHLPYLFTIEALEGFERWLAQQERVSPRCIVQAMERLAFYTYRHGLAANASVDKRLWEQFVRDEPKIACVQEKGYPMDYTDL